MKKDLKKNVSARYFAVGLLAFIIILLPFWLILINSFKSLRESSILGFNLPSKWYLIENYSTVIKKGDFFRGFFNTLFLTITTIPSIVILGSLASWIFARSKSKIISIIYYVTISSILIPPAVVTSVKVLKILHIYGSYLGIILFYIGTLLSFSIFFTTGFIKSIPKELEEAARIDGCTNIQVFFIIILPLLKPIIVTVAIFLTLSIWNDFIWPFYLLKGDASNTLVLGLYRFVSSGERSINWHLVFADLILVNAPLFIAYFFAQRMIISGIMGGAVKQ
ncbi:MAG: carbohydrate ABC transporter permease [Actinomycetota bacterium]|nr:carbohydrate ABC transporter permease [Actinomycetota bacterium]